MLTQPFQQTIKLHKPLLDGIAQSLHQIFKENRYADKVLERTFKQHKQWGSRDRKFIAESVYDIVRHYRLLSELAQTQTNFWFITSVYLVIKGIDLPDWPEFKHIDETKIKKHMARLHGQFALEQSYPDELNELGEKELGVEKWQQEATAMNETAEVVLRVNTLKTTVEALQKKLSEDSIETERVDLSQNALILKKRMSVFSNPLFQDGWFEIQDAGSQVIGDFVAPQPGQVIIDACAGAGGKSLHLAALMKNKGRIISMDVTQWKLDELMKRAKRGNAGIIQTQLIDAEEKSIDRNKEKADCVLMDVPCSGIGVLRRNPDAKWKFNKAVFDSTRQLQQHILSTYVSMVKPGGYAVYSTCSIFPSENKKQIELFLDKNSNFEFVDDKTIYPSEGFDGFYMCKLKRKDL